MVAQLGREGQGQVVNLLQFVFYFCMFWKMFEFFVVTLYSWMTWMTWMTSILLS